MKHNAAAWVLAVALLFIAPAAAAERPSYNRRTGLLEVPLQGLRKAAERGDRAELGRWAARIGVARLAKALADPDRSLALARSTACSTCRIGCCCSTPCWPSVLRPTHSLASVHCARSVRCWVDVDRVSSTSGKCRMRSLSVRVGSWPQRLAGQIGQSTLGWPPCRAWPTQTHYALGENDLSALMHDASLTSAALQFWSCQRAVRARCWPCARRAKMRI